MKMYDKFGLVLRIESTCNNVGEFRVKREVEHRDGTVTVEKAAMKKTIYSLYQHLNKIIQQFWSGSGITTFHVWSIWKTVICRIDHRRERSSLSWVIS